MPLFYYFRKSLLHEAIELGINFLDTAEVYGPFTNEELVGRAVKGHRDEVALSNPEH
jgi:aryl-alcohol dehydrogenase-like predicted oxidoreductase